MACDVSFTAQNNKFNTKSLLHFIWHLYSALSVGAVGSDLHYDLGLFLCVRDWFDEMKRYVAKKNGKDALQS